MITSTVVDTGVGAQIYWLATGPVSEELKRVLPAGTALHSVDSWNPLVSCVLLGNSPDLFQDKIRDAVESNLARVICVLEAGQNEPPAEAEGFPIFTFFSRPLHPKVASSAVMAAVESLVLSRRSRKLESNLTRAYGEIDELNKIGAALSAERNTARLLELILQKSREITQSDAGSLYLLEENERGEKHLRFAITQNDSVMVPFKEFTIPIDKSRISAYVALTGEPLHIEDAYDLPPGVPFKFSRDLDERIRYRTKSMLCVPMKNHKGEIVGVLQLLNRKNDWSAKVTPENAEQILLPYSQRAQHLASSLASQAAVSLENNRLIADIQNLFESFVKASVTAIEARDPTTSGHSFRVEKLTSALAEAVDRVDEGPYGGIKFTREQLQEIRYASVLHDFGKVGVREHVLVKANKLYPQQLDVVKLRFDFVRKALQEQHGRQRLQYLLEKGREEYLAKQTDFDSELDARLKEIDGFLTFALECNRPTVLPEGNFARIADMSALKYTAWDGTEMPLLTSEEVRLLSIPKGSLDDTERREIESHVVHTFNFLAQIPWTKELREIPMIARAHHEKLNGSGYPFRLSAQEIPVQSRMMTISDIYDALSASDRPYKRALPPEKALDIIQTEVKQSLLDEELFRIFLAKEIWKLTLPK